MGDWTSFDELSDASVSKIVVESFYASMHVDEGREVIFNVEFLFPGLGRENFVKIQDTEFTRKNLLKLAAAVGTDRAFQVSEINDHPCISGIASILESEPIGLRLSVNAPGNIVYHERPIAYQFNRGVFSRLRDPLDSPFVSSWITDCCRIRTEELGLDDERQRVKETLEKTVQRVVRARHGGTILLTTDAEHLNYLDIKYRCSYDSLSMKLPQSPKNQNEDNVFLGNYIDMLSKQFLSNDCASLAMLANLDGALVFDSLFRPVGFGAIITNESTHNIPGSLSTRGTRHKSAHAFASNCKGSIAIVISQDGDVTVFPSS